MNLSDFLTPAEVALAQGQLQEKLVRIEQERQAELVLIHERFDLLQKQAGREVLASVLSVSFVAPEAVPEPVASEPSVHNILTDEQTLSTVPSVSEPMPEEPERTYEEMGFDGTTPTPEPEGIQLEVETLTWERAAEILGVSRDTVRLYVSKGILKGQGPKGHVSCSSVMAYKKTRTAPGQHKPATTAAPPKPEFDINEEGKLDQIEQGKITYRLIKIFYLARRTTDSHYLWDSQPNRECDPGWEVVEEWRCNGLGRWESTPEIPGVVGTNNGASKGAAGYTVRVPG